MEGWKVWVALGKSSESVQCAVTGPCLDLPSHCFVEIADTVSALLCLKFSLGFGPVCIHFQR